MASSIEGAIAEWMEEENNYNRTSNTCIKNRICSRYKAIVQPETTHVGCEQTPCNRTNCLPNIMFACYYSQV
ncbi:unnamed protein product [Schistosoma turkestanicum]|nr:unnamed protein product [Schistosoma turkestanicum]CAH8542693.1 unnamed protein product [Schistosoma turkestanicum]